MKPFSPNASEESAPLYYKKKNNWLGGDPQKYRTGRTVSALSFNDEEMDSWRGWVYLSKVRQGEKEQDNNTEIPISSPVTMLPHHNSES